MLTEMQKIIVAYIDIVRYERECIRKNTIVRVQKSIFLLLPWNYLW